MADSPPRGPGRKFDIDAFFHEFELHAKAHAGNALLAAAILDQELKAAILTKMRPLSQRKDDRLFDGFAPLSEFAAKIELAYALDLITDEIYTELRAIKSIRDAFAHLSKSANFFSPEIVKHMKALKGWGKEKLSNPNLFYKSVDACLDHIKVHTAKGAERGT